MDKQVINVRQRLASTEVNQIITDTENYGQEIITKLNYGPNFTSTPIGFGFDSVMFGLIASAVGAPDFNKVNFTYGLGYHTTGKKIWVEDSGATPSGFQVIWDGVQGQLAHATLDRIDVVSIAHIPDSTVGSKYYIDTNPASYNYGQIISVSNVVSQTDYYTILVTQGTPNVVPAVPAIPAGYIPLAYVYIRNQGSIFPATVKIENGPTGHGYVAGWTSLGDIDNLVYYTGLTTSKGPTFRWFRNGSFYSYGTTDVGTGVINPVICPYSDILNYTLLVNTAGNTWTTITALDFNSGTQEITCSTGTNGAAYKLVVRGE